jgi:hypothetical protein
VLPTTNSEYAVLNTGLTPIKYTSTGTVRMEPPPPRMPSERPMKRAAK